MDLPETFVEIRYCYGVCNREAKPKNMQEIIG
jgi:hypothetical protein